ncbi:hypothetical protein B1218_36835, partial [Pseudomonas ogarae]
IGVITGLIAMAARICGVGWAAGMVVAEDDGVGAVGMGEDVDAGYGRQGQMGTGERGGRCVAATGDGNGAGRGLGWSRPQRLARSIAPTGRPGGEPDRWAGGRQGPGKRPRLCRAVVRYGGETVGPVPESRTARRGGI